MITCGHGAFYKFKVENAENDVMYLFCSMRCLLEWANKSRREEDDPLIDNQRQPTPDIGTTER